MTQRRRPPKSQRPPSDRSSWQFQRDDAIRALDRIFPSAMEPYGPVPDAEGRGGDADRLRDYKAVFVFNRANDHQVKRVLWDILATCGVFRTPFELNPQQMAFNAGMQHIGNTILATILDEAVEDVIETPEGDDA